jgi:prepilin-type N-terminal cleavage/methylation domain-containing protein
MRVRPFKAFTLSELLIALAILGVIATFTIPKVLQSQADTKYKSMAKEAAAMISEAYQKHKLMGKVTSATNGWDLTPYMNFVKVDTSTPIDDWQGAGIWGCDNNYKCLVLHNGARLVTEPAENFTDRPGTTQKDDALLFQLDPDGKVTNGGSGDTSATAPGKALGIVVYYDGGIGTQGKARPGAYYTTNGYTDHDLPWFNWN